MCVQHFRVQKKPAVDTLGVWLRAMVMDGLSAHAALNIGANMAQQGY